MKRIRWRLIWICALVAASVFFLTPRTVEERAYDPATGQMRDITVRRVPISLGLDLRGGVHLALEVDQARAGGIDCRDAIQRAERIVRARVDEFGTANTVVQVEGECRLIVEVPGTDDIARAREIVMRTAFLEFRITDSEARFRRALPSIDAALRRADPAAAEATVSLSALLQPGQLPGEFLVHAASVPDVERLIGLAEVNRLVPRGLELRWGSHTLEPGASGYRTLYAVAAEAIITGEALEHASAGRDPMTGATEVQFRLSRAAGRTFAHATGQNIGNHLAILLDGRVEGRPPVIQSRIDTDGRIQLGGRTMEEASDLALILRAGALPAPLEVVDQRTIGPSLGQDSIRAGVRASVLAVGLVLLVMAAYYGLAGLLAIGGLFLYMLFTLGGLAAFGFALTLPGLAGFALSIGMALDANVLIFERIREELGTGKSARAAVDDGFRNAMSAIIDSNVTTALTAVILYLVGTTPVKGFAITLLIGLAASMVSAVFVTRTFFSLWIGRRRLIDSVQHLSARWLANVSYDFVRMRRRAVALGAIFILPGLLLLAVYGATYSVEFTGGALLHVRTAEPVSTATLRAALEAGGVAGAEIQTFGSDREYVIRTRLDDAVGDDPMAAVAAAVGGAFDAQLSAGAWEIARTEAVTPRVGSELQQKAALAIVFSFVTTLLYLALRFEWRYGVAAVLATGHDILATLAFIRYLDLEVSLVVVAAVLTVVGYSLNDTIIIFDRVRENLSRLKRADLASILNASISETLPRTLLTGGTTFATAIVLWLFGGEVLRPFALVMGFGIAIGTFSSIFIAAPILLRIDRRRERRGRAMRGSVRAHRAEPIGVTQS